MRSACVTLFLKCIDCSSEVGRLVAHMTGLCISHVLPLAMNMEPTEMD